MSVVAPIVFACVPIPLPRDVMSFLCSVSVILTDLCSFQINISWHCIAGLLSCFPTLIIYSLLLISETWISRKYNPRWGIFRAVKYTAQVCKPIPIFTCTIVVIEILVHTL